ncbi:hypothetical protein CHGG_02152 [Chaetomium globosum CBS 148.51]|uniref:Hemerythrin-like domain-containing protein n=1 Tax=Chaetomium globosum (strain ATCC 6205 / CBS 148.51 / DSM 1962 / NBRC 6347 / NRRL 1970) TaxID=306901 RepID=Q2HCA2_CHAGB|nr:uncharacterized protein CHGG_02152 [Chaetomium globosum CBS 148.51]EAQ90217.1 hypothetical protein CHGG_02152 [Chaetomium globosum CBS 148.51]
MPRISKAVKQDHALIKRAFRRLREADPDTRRPEEFVWALDRYLIVEDLVVSPALDNHIARGGERHRRLSDDFDSMNAKLRHMHRFKPAEPSFDSSLSAIWVDLEPHIREETSGDLNLLEESLSEAESEALGKKYEDIKELLQRPYGDNGIPDERTLAAILEMPRQELMAKVGVSGE